MNAPASLDISQYEPEELHPDALLLHYAAWIVDGMARRGWVTTPHRIQNSAERRLIAEAFRKGLLNQYDDLEIMAGVSYLMTQLGLGVTAKEVAKLYRDLKGA